MVLAHIKSIIEFLFFMHNFSFSLSWLCKALWIYFIQINLTLLIGSLSWGLTVNVFFFFYWGRCFICLLEKHNTALLLYFSDLFREWGNCAGIHATLPVHDRCWPPGAESTRSSSCVARSVMWLSVDSENPSGARGCHLLLWGVDHNLQPPVTPVFARPVKMSWGDHCPPEVLRLNLLMPISSVRGILPPHVLYARHSQGQWNGLNGTSVCRFLARHPLEHNGSCYTCHSVPLLFHV